MSSLTESLFTSYRVCCPGTSQLFSFSAVACLAEFSIFDQYTESGVEGGVWGTARRVQGGRETARLS